MGRTRSHNMCNATRSQISWEIHYLKFQAIFSAKQFKISGNGSLDFLHLQFPAAVKCLKFKHLVTFDQSSSRFFKCQNPFAEISAKLNRKIVLMSWCVFPILLPERTCTMENLFAIVIGTFYFINVKPGH